MSSSAEQCDTSGSCALKKPVGIDNSDLVFGSASEESNAAIEIHDTLLEGRDYVLLPKEVWNQLCTWYESVFREKVSFGTFNFSFIGKFTYFSVHKLEYVIWP